MNAEPDRQRADGVMLFVLAPLMRGRRPPTADAVPARGARAAQPEARRAQRASA